MNILEGCFFLLSIEAALCTIRAAHSQRSLDMLHKTERKKAVLVACSSRYADTVPTKTDCASSVCLSVCLPVYIHTVSAGLPECVVNTVNMYARVYKHIYMYIYSIDKYTTAARKDPRARG